MEYCNGADWVPMGPVGGTPPTNGLVAHWALDETSGTTATDSAGTNDGTMQGGMSGTNNSVSSLLNGALEFDGIDDYISISHNAVLVPADWSLSAWFKTYGFTGDASQKIIKKRRNGSDITDYNMDINQPENVFRCNYEVTNTFVTAENVSLLLNPGQWYFATCTYDSATDTLSAYLDGNLISEADGSLTPHQSTTGNLKIGQNLSGPASEFNGEIDDVRIYNRPLSYNEILRLYNYGLSQGLGDVNNGCTNPVRDEGVMLYNQDFNVLQYCNGEEWIGVGQ
jgi:hypothetical protein